MTLFELWICRYFSIHAYFSNDCSCQKAVLFSMGKPNKINETMISCLSNVPYIPIPGSQHQFNDYDVLLNIYKQCCGMHFMPQLCYCKLNLWRININGWWCDGWQTSVKVWWKRPFSLSQLRSKLLQNPIHLFNSLVSLVIRLMIIDYNIMKVSIDCCICAQIVTLF